MTLPNEQPIAAEIATAFEANMQSMTDLHNAVVSMFGGNWTVTKPRGIDVVVANAAAVLLTKACKTYRAVQILCAAGLGTDAGVAARTLFETMVAVMFILQKNSKQRARMFHASRGEQHLKMLNHMKATPGLKRQATKKMFAKAIDDRDTWRRQFPATIDVKRHWSGLSNLEAAVKAVRGQGMYALFYRHTSSFAHVADFRDHIDVSEETGTIIYKLEPSLDHIDGQIVISRLMLWLIAARINERLGLGFDATLNPHKPPGVRS